MTSTDLSRATWRKSSYSSQNGACVEVATTLPGMVGVRDSKDPEGPVMEIVGIGPRSLTDLEQELAHGGRFVLFECCISLIVITLRRPRRSPTRPAIG